MFFIFTAPLWVVLLIWRISRSRRWLRFIWRKADRLIVAPADADGLRATLAEAHRSYAGSTNARRQSG
ncbi:MAG TPA: hypothetical protein VGQ90_15490 [Stellaceae bacterium]|nr:hypothetical protein [Stellaceae bacterium]